MNGRSREAALRRRQDTEWPVWAGSALSCHSGEGLESPQAGPWRHLRQRPLRMEAVVRDLELEVLAENVRFAQERTLDKSRATTEKQTSRTDAPAACVIIK